MEGSGLETLLRLLANLFPGSVEKARESVQTQPADGKPTQRPRKSFPTGGGRVLPFLSGQKGEIEQQGSSVGRIRDEERDEEREEGDAKPHGGVSPRRHIKAAKHHRGRGDTKASRHLLCQQG